MPKGITRSKWVPKLATAIGWKSQKLRDFFNSKGYFAPFGDDDARALKLLEEAKINTAKYRASKAAEAAQEVAGGSSGKKKAKAASRGDKIRAAFRKKLVRRLARLLPQGDTVYGQQRVRDILVKHGLKKPWNKDENEAEALAIFQQEGISIAKFEYANPPPPMSPGQELLPPAAAAPSSQQVVTTTPLNGNGSLPPMTPEFMEHYKDLVTRFKMAKQILKGYETNFIRALKEDRFGGIIPDPIEEPISALNVLRAPPNRALPQNVKALWKWNT